MGVAERISLLSIPDCVPRRDNRFTERCGQMYMALTGWRFGGIVPDLPKFVMVLAPHTSNWDFMVGGGGLFALDLRLSLMAKHTLFWEPFGTYLRWFGGVPVDRTAPHGLVGEAIAHFQNNEKFILVITPEGTRGKVEKWKSGFYHIACGAQVPIVPLALDYGPKEIRFGAPLEPTGDYERDRKLLAQFFVGVKAKHNQYFTP